MILRVIAVRKIVKTKDLRLKSSFERLYSWLKRKTPARAGVFLFSIANTSIASWGTLFGTFICFALLGLDGLGLDKQHGSAD
jgi:hypothetical protein